MIKIAYSIWTFGQLLSADERSEEQRKQACLRISGNKQDKKGDKSCWSETKSTHPKKFVVYLDGKNLQVIRK